MSDDNFISRWSRRKTASKAATARPSADAVPAKAGPQALAGTPAPAADAGPRTPGPAAPEEPPAPLPPVDSLTPESDFAPFMKAEVDPDLKRQAFKKLIEDPQFNVMDGLDVYIDDYSKPDPLPEGWLEKMNQVRRLGFFHEAADNPEEEPADAPLPLKNAMEEAPLEPQTPVLPVDTPGEGVPPLEVGKSGGSAGGI
jgi:hypothetical protein